jgi:hypothetical protein
MGKQFVGFAMCVWIKPRVEGDAQKLESYPQRSRGGRSCALELRLDPARGSIRTWILDTSTIKRRTAFSVDNFPH